MEARLLDEYHTLNTIIEQDRTVTTFKYALLRGTIEVCQHYSHLAEVEDDRVWYPLGLLIERWILYYYPIFENERFIPQLNGERDQVGGSKNILFRWELTEIIDHYRVYGGISAFYTDFRKGTLPPDLHDTMRTLIQKVRQAITQGPIKHLGFSHHHEHNAVFDWDGERICLPRGAVSSIDLIGGCGRFSLHRDLESLFKYFGSFIIGEGTLLNKWAEFTVNIAKAQGQTVERREMLDLLSRSPATERQTQEASRFYHQLLADSDGISCVWSGEFIKSHNKLHIDHLLPFSLWKNNDFWNLVPVQASVNLRKHDAIASPLLLRKRKELIMTYWEKLADAYADTFSREMRSALVGSNAPIEEEMRETAFENLVGKSTYLIEIRGCTPWNA